jgi:hypothetical protein
MGIATAFLVVGGATSSPNDIDWLSPAHAHVTIVDLR